MTIFHLKYLNQSFSNTNQNSKMILFNLWVKFKLRARFARSMNRILNSNVLRLHQGNLKTLEGSKARTLRFALVRSKQVRKIPFWAESFQQGTKYRIHMYNRQTWSQVRRYGEVSKGADKSPRAFRQVVHWWQQHCKKTPERKTHEHVPIAAHKEKAMEWACLRHCTVGPELPPPPRVGPHRVESSTRRRRPCALLPGGG